MHINRTAQREEGAPQHGRDLEELFHIVRVLDKLRCEQHAEGQYHPGRSPLVRRGRRVSGTLHQPLDANCQASEREEGTPRLGRPGVAHVRYGEGLGLGVTAA